MGGKKPELDDKKAWHLSVGCRWSCACHRPAETSDGAKQHTFDRTPAADDWAPHQLLPKMPGIARYETFAWWVSRLFGLDGQVSLCRRMSDVAPNPGREILGKFSVVKIPNGNVPA